MLGGFGRLSLSSRDRVMVLSPHPDDDAAACAGLLSKAGKLGIGVRLVYLTQGDERIFKPWRGRPYVTAGAVRRLGGIRRSESLAAAKTLGLKPEDLVFLGYPDRGALELWLRHWRGRPPMRNSRTRTDRVPYEGARTPGAPYQGDRLLEDLVEEIREFKPTKVFVSHPADRHPDHRAMHAFARAALWDLEGEVEAELIPYLVHYERWPAPAGYFPGAPLNPPDKQRDAARWLLLPLDESEVRLKRAATLEHRTPQRFRPKSLRSAVKRNELFGDLPPARLGAPGVFVPFLGGDVRTPGIEYASASIKEGSLRFRFRLSASLALLGGVSRHVFGHRRGEKCASMPKVHVRAGRWVRRIQDGEVALPRATIQVSRRGRDLELAVPLDTLGRPDRYLVAAQATAGPVVLGRETWRTLE
ncbi:MAG: PIG-L family deacetylase [Elusimicrobia bacterium]|nr:PIG-L family deacetylase [Elusimicrobiota bacterium]